MVESRFESLVIGYGNPWRGDDGIGPAVAGLIEDLNLPNVRVLAVHQGPAADPAQVEEVYADIHQKCDQARQAVAPDFANGPAPSHNGHCTLIEVLERLGSPRLAVADRFGYVAGLLDRDCGQAR